MGPVCHCRGCPSARKHRCIMLLTVWWLTTQALDCLALRFFVSWLSPIFLHFFVSAPSDYRGFVLQPRKSVGNLRLVNFTQQKCGTDPHPRLFVFFSPCTPSLSSSNMLFCALPVALLAATFTRLTLAQVASGPTPVFLGLHCYSS